MFDEDTERVQFAVDSSLIQPKNPAVNSNSGGEVEEGAPEEVGEMLAERVELGRIRALAPQYPALVSLRRREAGHQNISTNDGEDEGDTSSRERRLKLGCPFDCSMDHE